MKWKSIYHLSLKICLILNFYHLGLNLRQRMYDTVTKPSMIAYVKPLCLSPSKRTNWYNHRLGILAENPAASFGCDERTNYFSKSKKKREDYDFTMDYVFSKQWDTHSSPYIANHQCQSQGSCEQSQHSGCAKSAHQWFLQWRRFWWACKSALLYYIWKQRIPRTQCDSFLVTSLFRRERCRSFCYG